MRISKFLLTTSYGPQVTLPVTNVSPTDQFIVKNIDGLGPPEAGVRIVQTLNQGGFSRGRRPLAREIVIRVGLTPNFSNGQTASDLRQILYTLLSPGEVTSNDQLRFHIIDENNTFWAGVYGLINRIEVVPFSKDPEVQITMNCFSPFFQGPVVDIPVGTINRAKPIIANPGTAPAGFYLDIKFTHVESQPTVYLTNDDTGARLGASNSPSGLFATNDRLVIDTRAGRRRITRLRGETATPASLNLLPYVLASPTWHLLNPGLTRFQIGPGGTSGIKFDILRWYFFPQYWGI